VAPAIVFFAFIGFDMPSPPPRGNQESATRSADWDDRQSHHLHPAVCAHGAVLTGIKKYTVLSR